MASCGTRSGYASGCRCEPCRTAHRVYNREWLRKEARIRYGIEERVDPYVDATPARDHILWLQAQGMGRREVAKHARLVPSTIVKIRDGIHKRIRPETETRILAVNTTLLSEYRHVDATRTWQQIDELLKAGWSKARIGRIITGDPNTKSLQVHRTKVTRKTAGLIDRLWRQEFASEIARKEMAREAKAKYRAAQRNG